MRIFSINNQLSGKFGKLLKYERIHIFERNISQTIPFRFMKNSFLNIFLLSLVFYASAPKSNAQTKYYGPGGTYTDWYFPESGGFSSLEWTFVPIADAPESLTKEGLLHYYAYNFSLLNATNSLGSGYAGFQTNGLFKGQFKGKVVNFSIWGSNGGKTDGLLNEANSESGGFQVMYEFDWIVGHQYTFELKQGPSGTDSKGKWWGLWVTDKNTNAKTFIGEQRVASQINGKPLTWWSSHTSMFGEDLHWWKSLNGNVKYTDCSQFQSSAMAIINVSANNGSIKPIKFTNFVNSGKTATGNNGFKSYNCGVSIFKNPSKFEAQHNLGYWGAPNFFKIDAK